MTKKLIVNNKKCGDFEVLLDSDDFERISKFKWYINKQRGNKFRVVAFKKNKQIKLHRYILNITDSSVQVDHINGNPLDNRKCNLRSCSNQQNSMNRKIKNPLGYKGVFKEKKNLQKPYRAGITFNRKNISLGYFKTLEEAALAYNEAAKNYFKEFARLNKIK